MSSLNDRISGSAGLIDVSHPGRIYDALMSWTMVGHQLIERLASRGREAVEEFGCSELVMVLPAPPASDAWMGLGALPDAGVATLTPPASIPVLREVDRSNWAGASSPQPPAAGPAPVSTEADPPQPAPFRLRRVAPPKSAPEESLREAGAEVVRPVPAEKGLGLVDFQPGIQPFRVFRENQSPAQGNHAALSDTIAPLHQPNNLRSSGAVSEVAIPFEPAQAEHSDPISPFRTPAGSLPSRVAPAEPFAAQATEDMVLKTPAHRRPSAQALDPGSVADLVLRQPRPAIPGGRSDEVTQGPDWHSAAGFTTEAPPAFSSHPAPASTSAAPDPAAPPIPAPATSSVGAQDIEYLADRVGRVLTRRVQVERERRGRR